MMLNANFRFYIKHDYQKVIIKGFNQFSKAINEIVQIYLTSTLIITSVHRAYQFAIMDILQFLFGLTRSKIYTILVSKDAQILNKHILSYHSSFPCRSSSSIHMKQMYEICNTEFNTLITKFQDYFYVTIGENARKVYSEFFQNNRRKITPFPELFFGIIPPSQIFPNMNVHTRGILIPFLNARIFQKIKYYSSISEFVGEIKEPDFDNFEFIFRLSGNLGFIAGPPGKHKFYDYFSLIDGILPDFNDSIDIELSNHNIHDFTVVSVDCCNISVDKRDQTGSIGTGSRGSFNGHKASIGAGSYCLPFNSVTVSGNVSDSALFDATFTPIETLAQKTNHDIWVGTADAAYLSGAIIDQIENAEAIPFIDLNPRNSHFLQELKKYAKDLSKYSKKALKKGLTCDERKKWVEEAKNISQQNGGLISLQEKKENLQKLLRKYAAKARYHGLTPKERKRERKLRKKVMKLRAKIRKNGLHSEKKLGLSFIAHGTIEWYLVYGIRGQNEGINGILKKRDNLIGDGQHTTWIIGNSEIKNRVQSNIVYIKAISLVYYITTGKKRHCMRRIYNWRINHFFIILVVIDFVGKPPYNDI